MLQAGQVGRAHARHHHSCGRAVHVRAGRVLAVAGVDLIAGGGGRHLNAGVCQAGAIPANSSIKPLFTGSIKSLFISSIESLAAAAHAAGGGQVRPVGLLALTLASSLPGFTSHHPH